MLYGNWTTLNSETHLREATSGLEKTGEVGLRSVEAQVEAEVAVVAGQGAEAGVEAGAAVRLEAAQNLDPALIQSLQNALGLPLKNGVSHAHFLLYVLRYRSCLPPNRM